MSLLNDIKAGTDKGGVYSPKGDCQQYYDCKNGFLEAYHVCEGGFKFDIVYGNCITQKLVDSSCNCVTLEASNELNQPICSRESNNNILQPSSSSKNEVEDTNNRLDQLVE